MLPAMSSGSSVYLAVGTTDLRKAINGLSILVQDEFELNPFSGSLYGFCNRKRDLVKLLYWHRNGFCLWQKRLEKERFRWPESDCELIEITNRELGWLLDGLRIEQKEAHRQLSYSTLI